MKCKCVACDFFADVVSCIEIESEFDYKHYITLDNGGKEYWVNNFLHKLDGPALIHTMGHMMGEHWYWFGKRAIKIFDKDFKLYVGQAVEIGDSTGVVLRKVNDYFWEVLIGSEKKLIVSLDKYKEA